MNWKQIFDDPDRVGQAEYRAIHETVADAVLGTDKPGPDAPLSANDLELIGCMLGEFQEWAACLAARLGRHHLLVIWNDAKPELLGPFASEKKRDDKAREIRNGPDGKNHGLYRVSAQPPVAPIIYPYTGGFFETDD